jgi:hypothetical protein
MDITVAPARVPGLSALVRVSPARVARQAVTRSNLDVHDALPRELPAITLLFGFVQNNPSNRFVMGAISNRYRHLELKCKLSLGGT